MSAKKYFGAFCLYLNYLVHGIGVLVMSLNVHEFEVQWQTDAAGVSVVISSLGLGRLALLVLAGSLFRQIRPASLRAARHCHLSHFLHRPAFYA